VPLFRQREQAAEIPNHCAGGKRSDSMERQARDGRAAVMPPRRNNRQAAIEANAMTSQADRRLSAGELETRGDRSGNPGPI
jgi:hypothetical protein